jgi:hypothetical protein
MSMPPASAEPIEQTPPVGLSRSAGLTLGQQRTAATLVTVALWVTLLVAVLGVGALAGFWVLTRRRRAAASG